MIKNIYTKFLKIILSNLLFLLFIFSQQAISKPIPPGSGEGDVPANILILLDSSASMQKQIVTGDHIGFPHAIAGDANGDIYIGEASNGVIKVIAADEEADQTFANSNRNFRGKNNDTNCRSSYKNSYVKNILHLGIASNVKDYSGEVIYALAGTNNGKVVGISTAGLCVEVIPYSSLKMRPRAMEVTRIGTEDHLFVTGWWQKRRKKTPYFFARNLTTGTEVRCSVKRDLSSIITSSYDLTVDKDGSHVYFANKGNIWGFSLTKSGNHYCPTNHGKNRAKLFNKNRTAFKNAYQIAASADDANILYVASKSNNRIEKVQMTSASSVTRLAYAGRRVKDNNTGTAGAVAANVVNLWKPHALFVNASKVYVSDEKYTTQEFDENRFTTAQKDTSWQNEYGGMPITRYEGAKDAIKSVVTDSALTSGANFGYGHWNSGESGKKKKSHRGGWECHAKLSDCDYYRGWNGMHPDGKSTLCNTDSCLLEAIQADNQADLIKAIDTYGLAWGTDANAFSQMAYEYYAQHAGALGVTKKSVDELAMATVGEDEDEKDCQLSYVIVIGDGAMKNLATARKDIRNLRKHMNVKTLVVAYGGGIGAGAMGNFDSLARDGTCDDPTGAHKDCEETIVANTPQELKTELQSKIQQIIAERLAFTAPSITATIQEGGSIYQAQFNYMQRAEWEGTIYRKAILSDGTVEHDEDYTDPDGGKNWDASAKMTAAGSDDRNVWTTLPDAHYADPENPWNNWRTDNADEIDLLFNLTGNTVRDYHTSSSTCSDKEYPGGGELKTADGTDDDIKGLIAFARGKDYFNYREDCILTQDRLKFLGDIYHSQLVEVGAPSASVAFTSQNQEAYYRAKNGYSAWAASKANRKPIIYAGGNDGMLHAFNACKGCSDAGKEEWAFIPPFIAAKLPTIINKAYDGKVGNGGGGTNPIFGVDGSPVVHDMFINGLTSDGENWEDTKSWRTVLVIPYGRGGAGFSVLDVTNPLIENDIGPLHMYSVFNDAINNEVLVADNMGNVQRYSYYRGALSVAQSEEGIMAKRNQKAAETTDGGEASTTTTARDAAAKCKDDDDKLNDDVTDITAFRTDGDTACYKGKTFTFAMEIPAGADGVVQPEDVIITEEVAGELVEVTAESITILGGRLTVTFDTDKVFNASTSDKATEVTNNFNVQASCEGAGVVEPNSSYDFSQLGETWSTPRIFRIPGAKTVIEDEALEDTDTTVTTNTDTAVGGTATLSTSIDDDTYVAVMGGGMGNSFMCAGSNIFVVDLENDGRIFGYKENNGPINIVDLESNTIANAIPAAPVVITPDLAPGIPWRGAMVYANDLEGKITKLNLTNQKEEDFSAKLYDQTTILNINANKTNQRLSYFEMDATIGTSTNDFWLFGGTGNFERIGDVDLNMDNVLFGVRDKAYPFFKHFTSPDDTAGGAGALTIIPSSSDKNFKAKATEVAENAKMTEIQEYSLRDLENDFCQNTTEDVGKVCTVVAKHNAWVIHLDEADGKSRSRKVSASPTVYKGQVYFPIYEPPDDGNKCALGKAYVCSANDECGANNSDEIAGGTLPDTQNCHFVRRGILSKLVIFGDKLFGNVAGPSDTEKTLVQILAGYGEAASYRRSWRENY